ncbi:MAG: TonB family protein [Bryobacteraceae bacterium]
MITQADPELNLLLEWPADRDIRPRLLRAGAGTLAAHVVLVFLAILLATHGGSAIPSQTLIAASLRRQATHLVDPPQQLTQTAPNRAQVSKEVNLDSLLSEPRPARTTSRHSTFHPPAPVPVKAPKVLTPGLGAPPKLEASMQGPELPVQGVPNAPPPPQIQAQENPKLALENPGTGQGPRTLSANPRISELAPPKTSIDDAMHSVLHGSGQGGVVVGDLDQPPSLAETLNQSPAPGVNRSGLELLSDPKGVDFKPYLIRVLAAVRKNWFVIIPQSARMGRRGRVIIQFAIARDGSVPKLVIADPSGTEALDRAAVAGISASVPLPPLPAEYRGNQIRLQFSFQYNMPK